MEEKWKSIEGYEGLYEISTMGRVKSMERKVKNGNGYRIVRERILKPHKHNNGYLQLLIHKEGTIKKYYIHRLVAEAFISNPLNFPEVNHLNEDKTDNRLENLEFCDKKHNCNYGTRIERISKANSKPVKCIETGLTFSSATEVKRKFGFTSQSISACCNGKRKTCGKYHWKFVD